jgi:hypothetical protein
MRAMGRASRRIRILAAALAALGAVSAQAAPIDPSSATTGWTAIQYPALLPDFSDDQQTGIAEADIVGSLADPAFYYMFDDNGTAFATDGAIAFRVRVGADRNAVGFGHFMGVGIDANSDGALDIFLAVDNSGNPDQVGIFDAGTGANTSPSTTSIVSTALFSYSLSVSNYSFLAVDLTIDPTATTTDVDADGETDHFLTFVVPFADVVNALAAQGINVTDASVLSLVLGSSTQPNALNQDLGGPNGGTTSTQTWDALGAISDPLTAIGGFIPEPGTGALLSLGLCGLAGWRRTARHRC